MGRTKITKQELDAVLICDPIKGEFRWRSRMASTVPAGSIAGTTYGISTDGYCYIVLRGKRYPAHHLVWLHVHGDFPSTELDHEDRNKRHNSINNLRLVDKATQVRNTSKVNQNGMYLAGVNWSPQARKFRVFHKREYLGNYSSLLDAIACKLRAVRAVEYILHKTTYS